MNADDRDRASELRTLLRALRGDRRQREVAEAAGVSLSFYKRVEGGHAESPRLQNLIKVAQALGAQDDERASLIRLARPDLARMFALAGERDSLEESLRSVRTYATELVRTKGQREAVRLAVELFYAALEPDWMAFAFERRSTGELSQSIFVGSHLDALAWNSVGIPTHIAADGPHIVECADLRIVYAPIRKRGRVLAVLGLACRREREFDKKSRLFLDTVAGMLEMRLNGQEPSEPA